MKSILCFIRFPFDVFIIPDVFSVCAPNLSTLSRRDANSGRSRDHGFKIETSRSLSLLEVMVAKDVAQGVEVQIVEQDAREVLHIPARRAERIIHIRVIAGFPRLE